MPNTQWLLGVDASRSRIMKDVTFGKMGAAGRSKSFWDAGHNVVINDHCCEHDHVSELAEVLSAAKTSTEQTLIIGGTGSAVTRVG